MDINRDEVRRQLRASQREHDELMPRFRSLLARVFDHGNGADPADKARLLGIPAPSRRALLGGGLTVAGAMALAACTEPTKKEQLAQTGTVPNDKSTTTIDPMVAAKKAAEADVTLLRTAQSVEALAIVTYGMALASGKLTTPTVSDTVKLFQSQHEDHETAIVSQIRKMGGEPYTNPDPGTPPSGVNASQWSQVNPTLWKAAVEPKLANADSLTQTDLVKLASSLEDVAAETYTKAGGTLSSPELRAFIMSVGGIEARHLAVLLGVLTADDPRAQAPFAFEKTANAAPPEAYVGAGNTSGLIVTTTTTTAKAKATGSTAATGAGGSVGSAGAASKTSTAR
jgi:hypothetical protein